MSSYYAKASEIERKWYIIDAKGKPLGRVAVTAATLLYGKNKPIFTPGVDCGDHVIIINCKDAVLTGNKLNQKFYTRHTGWIGGLKQTSYKELMATRPDRAMYLAVRGMLPDTTIGRKALTRLRVYNGADHRNEAQKPEVYEG